MSFYTRLTKLHLEVLVTFFTEVLAYGGWPESDKLQHMGTSAGSSASSGTST
jgi:hypothetical protein